VFVVAKLNTYAGYIRAGCLPLPDMYEKQLNDQGYLDFYDRRRHQKRVDIEVNRTLHGTTIERRANQNSFLYMYETQQQSSFSDFVQTDGGQDLKINSERIPSSGRIRVFDGFKIALPGQLLAARIAI
jgi:hypothetical protein